MAHTHKNTGKGDEKTEEIVADPHSLASYVINVIQGRTEGKWMSYYDFLLTVTGIANNELTDCVIGNMILGGNEMLYKDGDLEIQRVTYLYNMLCRETSFWFRATYQTLIVGKKMRAIYIERILD